MTEDVVRADRSGRRTALGTFAGFLVTVVSVGALFIWASEGPTSGIDYTQYVIGPDHPSTVIADPPSDDIPPFTVSSLVGSAGLIALTLPGEEAGQLVLLAVSGQGLDLETARLLRTTSTSTDATGALRPYLTVGILADDGYREILGMDPSGSPLGYDPALLTVPADLDDGATWSAEALTAGFAPVTVTGQVANVSAPSFPVGLRSCRALRTTLNQEIPGADGYTTERESIWCPGWGAVQSQDLSTGVVTRLVDPSAIAWVPARPPQSVAQPAGVRLPSPISVMSIIRQPIEVDGTLVVTNAQVQDVIALTVGEQAADDPAVVTKASWIQHPGGIILGTGSGDDDFYVTTSQRRLQRFDSAGRLRWSSALPDIASGAPVVMPTIVAVALADGTLRGFDRSSGAQRWSVRLSDVITQSPVLAGVNVVAADTAGFVVSVDEAGSVRWSTSIDGVNTPLTALPDGSVVFQQRTGAITLLDSGGEQRWNQFLPDSSVTSSGTQWGDVVVLPTSQAVIGLNAKTGVLEWDLDEYPAGRVTANGLLAHGESVVRAFPDGRTEPLVKVSEADGAVPSRLFLAQLDGTWVAVTRGGVIAYLGIDDD